MTNHDCNADPCRHGQIACPFASACQVAEEDQSDSADAEVGRVILILIAVIGTACLVLHLAVNVFPMIGD